MPKDIIDDIRDSITSFASRVKAKFPSYQSIPDEDLVKRLITKYPQYEKMVKVDLPEEFTLPQNPALAPINNAMSAIGNQLESVSPQSVVNSPIGQEVLKPRMQSLGNAISNVVPHPVVTSPLSGPLPMLQDAVAGVGDLVGGAIGSLSAADLITIGGSSVEQGISALLKRNLPTKNLALAKIAITNPMQAIKSGIPVSEWPQLDEWVKELKAKGTMVQEAEWEPILNARAKNMVDEVNGLMPAMQNRPGFVGPGETPKSQNIIPAVRDPNTGKIYTAPSHKEVIEVVAKTGDNTALRSILKEVTGTTENTGFVDTDGSFITRTQAQEKYGFSTSEGLKAQGEQQRTPVTTTNASPAETLPIEQISIEKPVQTKTHFNREMKKTPNVEPWAANKVLEILNDPKTPSTMPKEGFLNVLKNKQVKPEQLEWDGLNDFLKGKEKITKKEVQKFVEENGLNLIEIDKGTGVLVNEFTTLPKETQKLIHTFEKLRQTKDLSSNEINKFVGLLAGHGYKVDDLTPFIEAEEPSITHRIFDLHNKTVKGAQDNTSYGHMKDLQLPGGTNYREKRFQLPNSSGPAIEYPEMPKDIQKAIDLFDTGKYPLEQLDTFVKSKGYHLDMEGEVPLLYKGDLPTQFTSGAYPEPGIVAETRYTDRAIGKEKIGFLEEVQSHMHQAGRERGYITNFKELPEGYTVVQVKKDNKWCFQVHDKNNLPISSPSWNGYATTKERAIKLAQEELQFNSHEIPNAPFKAGKHVELVMKRMVRQFIEEGKDGMAWTTGQMQKDRYKLSNWLSKIEYSPNAKKPGTFDYELYKKDGEQWTSYEGHTPEQIDKTIGKGYGAKLQSGIGNISKTDKSLGGVLETPELQVGGMWANNLYDEQMVNFANKFFGKWGAKVTMEPLTLKPNKLSIADKNELLDTILPGIIDKVPYLKFTPELKRAALKQGFPLYTGIGALGLGTKGVSEEQHK